MTSKVWCVNCKGMRSTKVSSAGYKICSTCGHSTRWEISESVVEEINAELKRQLSELENFAMLLCDDVFSMMVDMDLLEVQNYSGVLDTAERGRDGDFNG